MNMKPSILRLTIEMLEHVPSIGRHSLTVSVLSYLIAEEFFKDEEKAMFAGIGGMLHDIGYLVPSVSSVDVTLEDSDRKVDLHTTIGGYILSNFLGLYEYSDIAFYHHLPASELDPASFNHIVANIVGAADFIALRFGGTRMFKDSVVKDTVKSLFKEFEKDYFPEVSKAVLRVIDRDYTWWSLEDPRRFFEGTLASKVKSEERTSLETLLETGYFIAYLVDSKSRFTRKHSEKVADLSRALGKELGCDQSKQVELYIAGLFHDIGKVSIESSLLEKPGPLTTGEFWRMKKHVYYTMILLRHFEAEGQIWPKWAYQHHERLDGSGYPLRVSKDQIPVGSRILQVADVYVALTEDRPYRSPMECEQALCVLRKEVEKGRLDGDVVKALERLVKNGYTFPKKSPIDEIIETVDFLIESYGVIM